MTFDPRATERDSRARSASPPAAAPGKRTLVQDIAIDQRAPAPDDRAAPLLSSSVERDAGRPRVELSSLFGTRPADGKRSIAMQTHNAPDGRDAVPAHDERAAPGSPALSTDGEASAPGISHASQQDRSISASPEAGSGERAEHRAPGVAPTRRPMPRRARRPGPRAHQRTAPTRHRRLPHVCTTSTRRPCRRIRSCPIPSRRVPHRPTVARYMPARWPPPR